jgi:hypothetical protein
MVIGEVATSPYSTAAPDERFDSSWPPKTGVLMSTLKLFKIGVLHFHRGTKIAAVEQPHLSCNPAPALIGQGRPALRTHSSPLIIALLMKAFVSGTIDLHVASLL